MQYALYLCHVSLRFVFFFNRSRGIFFRIPLNPLPLDPAAGVENHRDPGENLTEGGMDSTEDLEIRTFFVHHPERNKKGKQ